MRNSSPHHVPLDRPAVGQERDAAVDWEEIAFGGIEAVAGGILELAGGLLAAVLAFVIFLLALVGIALAVQFAVFTWPVGPLLVAGAIIAYNVADDIDQFLGYLCVLAFGFFVWLTSPVGLWLLTTAAAFVVVDDLAGKVHARTHPYFGAKKKFALGLLDVLFQKLRDVIKCVAIGVCMVACMDAALDAAEWMVPADAVHAGENWVSSARKTISNQLTVKRLSVIFGVLAVASAVVPQAKLVSRFRTVSACYGRMMAVMLTITSFTFFASGDVDKFTQGWFAELKANASGNSRNSPPAYDDDDAYGSSDSKGNASGNSRSRVNLRAGLISAVWLGKGFDRLDEKSRAALEELFRQIRDYRGLEREIFREAAPSMVRNIPIPMTGERAAEAHGSRLIAARDRRAPWFANLDSRSSESLGAEISHLAQGRQAAIEIAKEVLVHQFPGLSNRMAELFVDEVGKALASRLLYAGSGVMADYLKSAWQWIKGQNVETDYYWRLEWRTWDGKQASKLDVAMLLYAFRDHRPPIPRPSPKPPRTRPPRPLQHRRGR